MVKANVVKGKDKGDTMKEGKSIKANIIFNFLIQIVTYLTPFILSPYLSRVLLASGIGEYTYGNSFAYYFCILISFGFTSYGNKKIAEERDDISLYSRSFWKVVISKFILGFLSISTYISLVALNVFPNSVNYYVYLALLLLLIGEMLDISFLFQGLEEFISLSIINVAVNILYMCFVFFFVRNIDDLIVYSFLKSGIKLACSIIMWVVASRKVSFVSLRLVDVFETFKSSVFYFLPSLVMTISPSLDMLMIGGFGGNLEVGYYEQVHKIVALICSLIYALGPILLSRISYLKKDKNDAEANNKFKKLIKGGCLILLPSIFGLLSICQYFVPLYFGDDFYPAINVMYAFLPEIFFSCISSMIINSFFYPEEKTISCTLIVFVSTLLNFLMNLFFISRFGAFGAAIASSLSGFIQMMCLIWFSKKKIFFDVLVKGVWKIALSSIIMMGSIFLFNYLLDVFSINKNFVIVLSDILFGAFVYSACLLILKEDIVYELIKSMFKRKGLKK